MAKFIMEKSEKMNKALLGFFWNLKHDKRGVDGIVVAVLLVLVAVLAVVLFWGQLKDLLSNLFGQITEKAGEIN